MKRYRAEQTLLPLWAIAAGLALWMPAVGVPVWVLPMQPMDIVVLAGLPLLAAFVRALSRTASRVLLPCVASIALSWVAMGGQVLVLGWTVVFALPFVALMTLTLQAPLARRLFLRSFLVGGALSATFFLLQITFGAEGLDWRSNLAFRLPPQYGRAFALFPEVSTFATHAAITCGMVFALILHRQSLPRHRHRAVLLLAILGLALLFSRSTTVLVLVPLLGVTALSLTTRLTMNTLLLSLILIAVLSLFMAYFLQTFYMERLESDSAGRSVSMRLASILGGLSPLISGEMFGVGIGENSQVTRRAYDAAQVFGLRFGKLPDGVNSQIIGRIFEEGWAAVVQMAAAVWMLMRSRISCRASPEMAALFVLAMGSFLSALMISGYRGIYTNWFWLAAAAAWAPAMARHYVGSGKRRAAWAAP